MAEKVTRTLLIGLTLCGVCLPREARAFTTEVDATLDAQFYSLQSPYGSPLVQRRRYTQTLALKVYDLQADRRPLGPTLAFKSRMRLDADFGQRPEERNPDSASYIPGLVEAPLDVMYAYLEGQRYFDGALGFRLGRQYVVDSLGFWSFDGAELMLTTPAYLAFELYAGFEQRGGLPCSPRRASRPAAYRAAIARVSLLANHRASCKSRSSRPPTALPSSRAACHFCRVASAIAK